MVLFWTKNANFLEKMLTSAKLRRPRHQKVHFLKLDMDVYLRPKFEVSSIILTSFRHGKGGGGEEGGNFTPSTPQNEPLKSPPRLGLSSISTKFSNKL